LATLAEIAVCLCEAVVCQQFGLPSGVESCKQGANQAARPKGKLMKKNITKKQWNKPAIKEVLISLESTAYSASV
jgi:pyrroloquinoline quinone biosynthesis protein B